MKVPHTTRERSADRFSWTTLSVLGVNTTCSSVAVVLLVVAAITPRISASLVQVSHYSPVQGYVRMQISYILDRPGEGGGGGYVKLIKGRVYHKF